MHLRLGRSRSILLRSKHARTIVAAIVPLNGLAEALLLVTHACTVARGGFTQSDGFILRSKRAALRRIADSKLKDAVSIVTWQWPPRCRH